ncbi:hypothetical protein NIES267_53860 [Calothrix parasitica NIES-267]|uniref:Uncharacterized protein n=1 Tax=Calothrix parasitica NIES-267 TaxID=1973488 RepID=A0A1Z4LXF8_9CYAN|nr:hypothetical protein NIES267_53860 [Calothrix parasitica NIES-267]
MHFGSIYLVINEVVQNTEQNSHGKAYSVAIFYFQQIS